MAQNDKAKEDQKNGRLLLLTPGQNPLFSEHIIGLKKKSDLENQNASLIRRNISQLTSELICSVLGNCLTLYESKKLYLQLEIGSTPAKSEYEIHGKLVAIASVKGQAARVIHKFIDEKFQLDVRKFSKISNANEIADLWNESLQLGNISGSFWASITHPLCSNQILKEIYGYVHMRTHFVGSLDKFELKKYDELQVQSTDFEKEIQLIKINHFEQTHSRDVKIQNLEKKVQDQQLELVSAKSLVSKPSKSFLNLEIENNNLTNENSKFTNRVSSLEENLKKIKAQQIQSDSEIKSFQSANKDLLQEVETLELLIRSDFDSKDVDHNVKLAYLKGRTFLYVGGTHQLAINIKNVASKMEFQCLFHDGGVEDRIGLLIGLINQAEIIFFPMNHVSHAAVSIIKSQADKTNKVYAPLKSSGLSTFLVALYAEGA